MDKNMKSLRFILVILLIVLAEELNAEVHLKTAISTINDVKTCPTCAESKKFIPECRLLVSPCIRQLISEIDKALDEVFATRKPVILYIHGRGNEPEKTFEERILETLEAEYGVKVLMLNWDSKAADLRDRPIKEAHESAPYFQEVIKRLAQYRKSHPETKAINISLLVHSMGNLVLRKAMDNFELSSEKDPVFTNILLTSSDEDAEEHNLWVEKLSASGTILITINKHDATLRLSNHPNGKNPLGLSPKPPLATNAYYLDLTGFVGKVHRIFTKDNQHDRVAICEIFTAMLRGDKPNLEIAETISRKEQGRIFIPIAKQDKNNSCFKAATN